MNVVEYIEKLTNKDELYLIRRKAHNRILELKGGDKRIAKPVSEWAIKWATSLRNYVQANYSLVRDIDIEKWARDIDKIHDIDQRPKDMIEYLLVFSQQDDFWKQQIRSGGALRRHFEKLYVKAKSSYEASTKGKVHKI